MELNLRVSEDDESVIDILIDIGKYPGHPDDGEEYLYRVGSIRTDAFMKHFDPDMVADLKSDDGVEIKTVLTLT